MCSNVAMISDLWRREVGGTQITHMSNIGQTPQDLSWYPMLKGKEFFKLISQSFMVVPHHKRHHAVILGVCHCHNNHLAIIIQLLYLLIHLYLDAMTLCGGMGGCGQGGGSTKRWGGWQWDVLDTRRGDLTTHTPTCQGA